MNAFSWVQHTSTRPFFIFPFIRFFMVTALLVSVIFMSAPLQAQIQTGTQTEAQTEVQTGEDTDVASAPVILAEDVPGMQVVVDILGGKRTVLEYLLTRIRRASDVAFREK